MLEPKRGCGYRSEGGLYLRGIGLGIPCDRLPFILDYCPVCGSGIKFTRGMQMLEWYRYAGMHEPLDKCKCNMRKRGDYFEFVKKQGRCPVCLPRQDEKYALMWVGAKYYSPESFTKESKTHGVCKRIATVPKGIKIGETWILLAHKKAGKHLVKDNQAQLNGEPVMREEECSAVFYAFRPTSFELLINKKQSKDKKFMEDLKKRGITPVIVTKTSKEGEVLEVEKWKEKKKPR